MKKIMLFILGLMLNMVPALAEGEGYSARYVSLGHQSAVVYQPTMKSAKTGIGIVVMHSDQDYMGFLPIQNCQSVAILLLQLFQHRAR